MLAWWALWLWKVCIKLQQRRQRTSSSRKRAKKHSIHRECVDPKIWTGRRDTRFGIFSEEVNIIKNHKKNYFLQSCWWICSRPCSLCILAEYNLSLNKYEGYYVASFHESRKQAISSYSRFGMVYQQKLIEAKMSKSNTSEPFTDQKILEIEKLWDVLYCKT